MPKVFRTVVLKSWLPELFEVASKRRCFEAPLLIFFSSASLARRQIRRGEGFMSVCLRNPMLRNRKGYLRCRVGVEVCLVSWLVLVYL